jgi:spore maturation protein CgeB
MSRKLNVVILGLSLSSSWGNGHATTYRGLIRGLSALGHRVLFLERDVEWYRSHRDLARPDFCELGYYDDLDAIEARFGAAIARADAVIVGSYVPEGIAVIGIVAGLRPARLCFYDIDTPVTLAGLERDDCPYLARRQVPLFDDYLSFTGGPTLTRLRLAFGARRAHELYCSVDAERYRPTGEPTRWDLGYLGTYSPDRQPMLEKLLIEPARQLPNLSFVVAGPQYPATIDWPGNVERIEHLAPTEHASFYSRQRFTLNVTRADMVAAGWSPSVRLFEAAACATPILSDAWRGLDSLLPDGQAIRIVQSTAEVVDVLTGMGEAERRRLGEAARRRILARHTGVERARHLVALLAELPDRAADTGAEDGAGDIIKQGAVG